MPNDSIHSSVPPLRVRAANDAQVRADGDFVLYWMIATRRASWNFALDLALDWARDLNRPLVVLEALRAGYRWASDRLHRFVLDGMHENARRLEHAGIRYYPYVEPTHGAGKGLLEALAKRACVVVADEFPAFFLPHMVAAAAARLPVRLEAVDSNGLLPLRAADQAFTTAHSFRRWLQKNLPSHLGEAPRARPLARLKLPEVRALPAAIARRWPAATDRLLSSAGSLSKLPIDHTVTEGSIRGGVKAASAALRKFLDRKLERYLDDRNALEADATSGLSPYLHFGHISAHEVFAAMAEREEWSADNLSGKTNGSREGWWGASPAAEAFLDQLVTWRELGFNMCAMREDYDRYESLPDWAQRTLARHARDRRPQVYSLEEFEQARTHDPLWNAVQLQLVREGRIHNYLRMLWGKKILEWSASPQESLEIMIELNNKYALDGRDPNSYSGIFWILGRYDRAWGPERPIFGTVRYMSSESTARKYRVRDYVARYTAPQELSKK